jgi:hypothetical protein
VTTEQIYWGAVPYVVLQLLMVGLVMASPGLVMRHIVKPVAYPPAAQHWEGAAPGLGAAGRLILPPSPPPIDGAPAPGLSGPGAPTLDMSVPPVVEPPR